MEKGRRIWFRGGGCTYFGGLFFASDPKLQGSPICTFGYPRISGPPRPLEKSALGARVYVVCAPCTGGTGSVARAQTVPRGDNYENNVQYLGNQLLLSRLSGSHHHPTASPAHRRISSRHEGQSSSKKDGTFLGEERGS